MSDYGNVMACEASNKCKMASEDQHELEGGLLILQKIKRGTLSEKLDLKTKKFQNYFRTENTDRWGELTHHEAEE